MHAIALKEEETEYVDSTLPDKDHMDTQIHDLIVHFSEIFGEESTGKRSASKSNDGGEPSAKVPKVVVDDVDSIVAAIKSGQVINNFGYN